MAAGPTRLVWILRSLGLWGPSQLGPSNLSAAVCTDGGGFMTRMQGKTPSDICQHFAGVDVSKADLDLRGSGPPPRVASGSAMMGRVSRR